MFMYACVDGCKRVYSDVFFSRGWRRERKSRGFFFRVACLRFGRLGALELLTVLRTEGDDDARDPSA